MDALTLADLIMGPMVHTCILDETYIDKLYRNQKTLRKKCYKVNHINGSICLDVDLAFLQQTKVDEWKKCNNIEHIFNIKACYFCDETLRLVEDENLFKDKTDWVWCAECEKWKLKKQLYKHTKHYKPWEIKPRMSK